MSDSKEKRYIGDTGYEVKHSLWLGGKEILLAENMQAKDGQYYLIAQYVEKGFLCEYSRAAISDDYLEILRTFTERINKEVMAIQAERDITNYPPGLFTAEHCYPHSYDQSIAGKVVIIKPSVLSPEYRYGDNTLVYATHGNGTAANARGSAVFCYHLNTGKHTRFERQDVMGIIRPEYMPDWAHESLERIERESHKPAEEKEYAGKYEITERIEVGQKVFVLGYNEHAVNKYGTWQGYKGRKGDFDYGHYHDDYDAAKADLRERAALEHQRNGRDVRVDRSGR